MFYALMCSLRAADGKKHILKIHKLVDVFWFYYTSEVLLFPKSLLISSSLSHRTSRKTIITKSIFLRPQWEWTPPTNGALNKAQQPIWSGRADTSQCCGESFSRDAYISGQSKSSGYKGIVYMKNNNCIYSHAFCIPLFSIVFLW